MSRTEKIFRAAEAMKQWKSTLPGGMGPEIPPSPAGDLPRGATEGDSHLNAEPAQPAKEAARTAFTVTYFHRTGCPHCDTQDLVLAGWLKGQPEGKLVVVDFGDKPELWRQYRVRGTPSLVIEAKGSGRPVFLEGLSQETELKQALRESSLPPPKKTSGEEGGEK